MPWFEAVYYVASRVKLQTGKMNLINEIAFVNVELFYNRGVSGEKVVRARGSECGIDHPTWRNNYQFVDKKHWNSFLNCLEIWFHSIERRELEKCCRVCVFFTLRDFSSFPSLTTSDIQKMGIRKHGQHNLSFLVL